MSDFHTKLQISIIPCFKHDLRGKEMPKAADLMVPFGLFLTMHMYNLSSRIVECGQSVSKEALS